MIEEWKDMVGYEGYYQVSSNGSVRSSRQVTNTYVGKILKPSFKKKGKVYYEYLTLSKNNVVKTIAVHRMVATTFLGTPVCNRNCVRHLDGNSLNNDILNLKWGTYVENAQDSIRHGTSVNNAGSRHGMSKLKESMIHSIRRMSLTMTRKNIADHFMVGISTIDDVIKGRTWKHVT